MVQDGATRAMPSLMSHLPDATTEALSTFEELPDCTYETSRLGRTRGQDDPACECTMEHGPAYACTDESGCINRLTQVECLRDVCRCGEHCANQRFQRHAYAHVDIIKTPEKGFGIRACSDIERDEFVFEYIGEIITHDTFMRRMAQYKEEHLVHFYFMMLQRDEYIDATKRGGRARFINHSCNPNCYVSKWHVGRHVRMGIFAKRAIRAGEELSFNYNADRYGNDPQPCYCGEPNCVGTIGGRTQTDVVTMDDRFILALDIADQMAELRASLPRGRHQQQQRAKILNEDFHPILHAIAEPECARVMTAVRDATTNRRMIELLLTRIAMTDDMHVQKMLVKMHGFVIMAQVLEAWSDDAPLMHLALECLAKWPLRARDKLVDSGVDELVHQMQDDPLAQQLHESWSSLPSTFRIARREGQEQAEEVDWAARRRAQATQVTTQEETNAGTEELRRSLLAYREHDDSEVVRVPRPKIKKEEPREARPSISLDEIIRRANEQNEAAQKEQEAKKEQEAREEQAASPPKKRSRHEPDIPTLERHLHKLVGTLVVKQMSKVKSQLDREHFKRHAKELTQVLCDKEKRNPKAWPPRLADGQVGLVELPEDKRKKMKVFAHDYIKKIVRHTQSKARHQDTSIDADTTADASIDVSDVID